MLVGILLLVFIKESECYKINNLATDIVKCGLGNQLGNKGAVIIHIKINDTTLSFTNVHLEAGHTKSI